MRNLSMPRQYVDKENRTTFNTGVECLVLHTASGDPVTLRFGSDGWLYFNDVPFGLAGMPPAQHQATHKTGGSDALSPTDIGAADAATVRLFVKRVKQLENAVGPQDEIGLAKGTIVGWLEKIERFTGYSSGSDAGKPLVERLDRLENSISVDFNGGVRPTMPLMTQISSIQSSVEDILNRLTRLESITK